MERIGCRYSLMAAPVRRVEAEEQVGQEILEQKAKPTGVGYGNSRKR
jgi:hypothetical protein